MNSNWFQNRKNCCNRGNITLKASKGSNHSRSYSVCCNRDGFTGGGVVHPLALPEGVQKGAIFHDKAKKLLEAK